MKKLVAMLLGFSLVASYFLLTKDAAVENTPQITPPRTTPQKPNITKPFPGYQDYAGIQRQLEEWKAQAPGLAETGNYGSSTKGLKLSYLRICDLSNPPPKKVLITACIHGNEPLAASTTMALIGTMLSSYRTDPEVTELIDSRDLYFVPVVSPDSYPNSRHVDGVDPNRNFPSGDSKKSVKPLDDLQKWFVKIGFNAAMSGHTFGRVYLIPYGDKTQLCPNDGDYVRIIGKMQESSQYRRQRACEMYGKPIYGSEVDWYYRHNCFSIVCEYGTHQRIPTSAETKEELDRTYKATLHFIREAPLVLVGSGFKPLPEIFDRISRVRLPRS